MIFFVIYELHKEDAVRVTTDPLLTLEKWVNGWDVYLLAVPTGKLLGIVRGANQEFAGGTSH